MHAWKIVSHVGAILFSDERILSCTICHLEKGVAEFGMKTAEKAKLWQNYGL